MRDHHNSTNAVRRARAFALAGTALLALSSTEALAEAASTLPSAPTATPEQPADGPPAPGAEAAKADAPSSSAEIVVTGSRISRNGSAAPTPVTVIDAARITNTGATAIAEVLNQTPLFRASNGPNVQFVNFNANQIGIRQLDLRGLGPTRTLVLVDGRRYVPSTPQNTVDLNQIPTLLIARTEVVTGGASAAYGSDAVSGVVNLILDNRLKGIRGTVQYGQTEEGDGKTFLGSVAGGTSFADDRIRIVGAFEFENRTAVGNCYTRDWCAKEIYPVPNSAAATNGLASMVISADTHASTTAPGGVILGYRTTAAATPQVTVFNAAATNPLRGVQFDAAGNAVPFTYGTLYGPTFMVGGSGDGTNPLTSGPLLSPSLRRYNAYGHAEADLTDNLMAFADLSYGHSRGVANGPVLRLTAGTAVVLQRDNPYLPASILASMTQVGAQSIVVGKQGGDIGNAVGTGVTETWRGAVGLKGTIAGSWKWDGYYQYGRSTFDQSVTNNQIVTNFNRAVDAVRNAAGQIVCRVNQVTVTDAGCSPLNILGVGNASAASQSYAFTNSTQHTVITQHVGALNVQGNLFSITSEPVSAAAGIEFRRDGLDAESDPISRALGLFINAGANVDGRTEVVEGYGELNVPIFRDGALGRMLDFNGAIRRTHYNEKGTRFLSTGATQDASSTFGATTWKLGAIYEPVSSFRLRATRSRDIRAPNLSDLYATETSVPTAVNGIVLSRRTGGNPSLTPEKADALTVGGVFRPTFLRATTLSIDYFDIKVKNAVSTLGAVAIVNGCAAGNALNCSLITFNGTTPTVVRDINLNVARLRSRGIDFELDFRLPVTQVGNFDVRLLATRNLSYVTADGLDRLGQTGVQTQGQPGVPDWSLNGLLSFDRGPFGLTAQGRYITRGKYDVALVGPEDAGYVNTSASAISSNRVAARFYLDLSLRYNLFGASSKRSAQLFFTVNNVFDRDPPVAPGNGIATNSIFFDTFGRRFSGGLRFGF
jgi:outer membrane receptor protein involved in Fe transport